MATYCTTTSLQTLMVGTTFDTATTALAGEAIAQAETDINAKLSKRYDISSSYFQTTTATPPLIQTICKRRALGYTYEALARGAGPSSEVFTRAERYIKSTTDVLDAIASYQVHLLDSAGSVIPEASNGNFQILSSTEDYAATFNEDDPLSWKIDDEKLDDIDSERS